MNERPICNPSLRTDHCRRIQNGSSGNRSAGLRMVVALLMTTGSIAPVPAWAGTLPTASVCAPASWQDPQTEPAVQDGAAEKGQTVSDEVPLATDGLAFAEETTVGFPVSFSGIVVPAPRLAVRTPQQRTDPVRLRIDRVDPHGTAFRYELTAIGLEPGEHRLGDYLVAEDGSAHPRVPEMRLRVRSVLPPGQIEPHRPVDMSTGWRGLYLPILVAGGMLWLLGLVAILFVGRSRTSRPGETNQQLTLADRLRPKILRASQGELSPAEAAELERTLTSFWKHRLRLEHLPPERLLGELRKHEEAGPLLELLQQWLHSPHRGAAPDLEQLLRPYRVYAEQGS